MRDIRCSSRSVVLPRVLAALLLGAGALQAQEARMVFVDGQAQVVPAFDDESDWIRHDLWVVTESDSDGDGRLDRVHMDVTRPGQTEDGLKVPVIYESSPYYSGTGSTSKQYMWNPEQELGEYPEYRDSSPPIPFQGHRKQISNTHVAEWVPRGFAVVHSESPGTGSSQGCPTAGGENESLAPKAVIDWLNGRAKGYTSATGDEEVECYWSTGKVGMTGTSYNGTLSIAAATTGVEGLEAIIPVAPLTSYYRYYRSNGMVRHPGGYMGEDIDVIYDFIHSGNPDTRDWCNENVRDGYLIENQDRVTGDYNEFWAGREYDKDLSKYRAATLMSHGWNDWNVMPEHSVRFYKKLQELGVPVRFYCHQAGHGGPPPFEHMNRWFSRWLCGIENGIENEPLSWIVREGDRPGNPTPYPDYPHPDAAPVTLYPAEGGDRTGDLGPEQLGGQGVETLVDDVKVSGEELAAEKSSKNRLLYATPELTEPLHLSGTGSVTVRLASNEPAVNLSVWIVSLPWTKTRDINSNIITRGWADPQNHESLSEGRPLEKGEFVDVTFELQPDDQVIPAGARIGLMVFSSDQDFTLWPPKGTKMSVDLDGTSLTLPVVGGAEAFARATGAETR